MSVPADFDLEGSVRSWLTALDVTIPDPKPFGLRDGEIVDSWGEDDDDVYVIHPDKPTIDDLVDVIAAVALTAAAMVVGTVLGTGFVVRAVRRRWAQ